MLKKPMLKKWDSVEYLKTEEDISAYLEACFEEAGNDPSFIAKALGNIARARGITSLSRDTGISREGLYKALSGNSKPEFATIIKVMQALGFRLQARPI